MLFWTTLLLALVAATLPVAAQQTPLQIVSTMVHNERDARHNRTLFRYTSEERSTRTGGHLWKENVVETPEGVMRRLIAEDGKPLSPERAAAENRRIAALVADPEAYRAANADRQGDETRVARLLDILPRAFILNAAGAQDGCVRIAYSPNPSFVPSSYEERIVHGMAGIVLVRTPANRLCGMDGHLVERINFGYGLLGHVEKGSRFSLTRMPVLPTDWKTIHINVHMDGKILMLKSISRDQESTHTDERPVPSNLSLAQVAALTRS